MADLLAILDFLGDGEFHSGEDLANRYSVSRTAIWKQIKNLNALLPMEIKSISGKGYQIEYPISVLNKNKIISSLATDYQTQLGQIDVLLTCKSTNQYLLEMIDQSSVQNRLVVAEMQTEGRGRRGRQWVSPFASNVYMSLLWGLDISIAEMAGLSLVVAIGIAKAMQNMGIKNVKLKWPNDIYVNNKKLSGVLLELRGESNSLCHAVIGMGVNVNMPETFCDRIDQAWTDMQTVLNSDVNRNEVVANILNELIPRLKEFNSEGFKNFMAEWKEYDLLEGKQINLINHLDKTEGIARGVDKYGALLLEKEGKLESIFSGEVSVREKCLTC